MHYADAGALFVRSQNVRDGRLDFSDRQYVILPAGAEGTRTRLAPGDVLITITGNSVGNVAWVDQDLGDAYISQHVGLVRLATPTLAPFVCRYLAPGAPGNPQIAASQSGQSKPGLNLKNLGDFLIALPPPVEANAIAAALSDVDALLGALDRLIAKKRDLKQAAMQQLLTGQTRLPGFSGKWESGRLEGLSAFITKGSTPTTYGYSWETDGVLFLRSECVSDDGLDLRQSMFISESAHATLRRSEIRNGDILMTITGNVGRVVLLADITGTANINQHIARIRIHGDRANPPFVYHFMSQRLIREYYGSITTGQAYPQISLQQVRKTEVPLPSLQEQKAIAAVLSDMDTELIALEQRRDKTQLLKQGMMQELLTGRTRLV